MAAANVLGRANYRGGYFTPSQIRACFFPSASLEAVERRLESWVDQGACFHFGVGEPHDGSLYAVPALLGAASHMEATLLAQVSGKSACPSPDVERSIDFHDLNDRDEVLLACIASIGKIAGHHGGYWRNGVIFYSTEHQTLITLKSSLSSEPAIIVQGRGGQADQCVESAREGASAVARRMNIEDSTQYISGVVFGMESYRRNHQRRVPWC